METLIFVMKIHKQLLQLNSQRAALEIRAGILMVNVNFPDGLTLSTIVFDVVSL